MRTLRYAFRTLFRSPFVTIIAIISLAFGIGANSAIFSLFDQLLLKPLPVEEPGRLVNFGAPGPMSGSTSCNQAGDCDEIFSYPMFRDLSEKQTSFTGIAAHRLFGANLGYQNQTLSGESMLVSGSYFGVLGLKPFLGRLIGPDDDKVVGEPHIAVLSHQYWRSRFGARRDVLNETMIINGQSMTIVGVAPEGFSGTTAGAMPKVFVPVTMRGLMEPPFKGFDNRQSYWAYLFARLKPGVSIEQARATTNGLYHAVINEVEAPLQKYSEATMAKFRAKPIVLELGSRGQSGIHKEATTPLLTLMCVTGVVLLIACANIANLLLVRAVGRSTEMAVRLSIGAGRGQLIRQLLVESCLLAVLGGLAGMFVAHWTLGAIQAFLPPDAGESMIFTLNADVLVFAMLLSLGTGVLFGLFPAFHSTRPDLATTLKNQAGQPGGARSAKWFRTVLATMQVTLSMALLVMAGLFTKSLMNVSRVDLGLKIDNVVTFGISPRMNGYTPDRARALFVQAEEALAALPGVTDVTAALVPLLGGSNWGTNVTVQGFQSGPDIDSNSRLNEIGPGYFKTMGIPMMSGREFTAADTLGAPKVAIVNETFAKKFNLGRDAVGKFMAQGGGADKKLDIEIVGIVQDAKYSEVKAKIPPLFFTPYRQDERLGDANLYVRTAVDPTEALRAIPGVIAKLDANLPVEQLRTMPEVVRQNVFLDRMISTLSASFAGLATVLAAIGLYGVLAYTVSQRTREFGLRMALGADPPRVRWLVMRQVLVMTGIGGVLGIAAAVYLGHVAQSLLFELKGYDPTVLVLSAVALVVVAFLAGLLPALRASRIDPMRALRYE